MALCDSGLWLQSAKLSEYGQFLVLRLSEQDGRRTTVRFPERIYLLNMLEDPLDSADGKGTDRIEVKPFEIITIGMPLRKH